MPRYIKWNYKLLVDFFAQKGHKLLAKEYTGSTVKYDYQCKCGNSRCSITIAHLKADYNNCKPCALEKQKATTFKHLGCKNPAQNAAVQEKIKATNVEKRGCEYSFQDATVKEKIKAINIQKFGYEYPMQNASVREKYKATNMDILGSEYPMQNAAVQEKYKETNLENLGCRYPAQNRAVQEKMKATCLKKLGCENAMQNSEVFDRQQKSAFKRKPYRFASGKEIEIQGYEAFALNLLLEQGVKEEDLLLGFSIMPRIMYEHNGKMHRYYPDIFIHSQNKIVEVKSEYTYELAREITHLKIQTCHMAGFKAEIWIFSSTGALLRIVTDDSLNKICDAVSVSTS